MEDLFDFILVSKFFFYFRYLEEDRKEMSELRREQQELLSRDSGPGESLSIMYSTLLRKYESVKEEYAMVNRR